MWKRHLRTDVQNQPSPSLIELREVSFALGGEGEALLLFLFLTRGKKKKRAVISGKITKTRKNFPTKSLRILEAFYYFPD